METKSKTWKSYYSQMPSGSDAVFARTMLPGEYTCAMQVMVHEGLLDNCKNIIEIGGGFGGLAMLVLSYGKLDHYIDIDHLEMFEHFEKNIKSIGIKDDCCVFFNAEKIAGNLTLLSPSDLLITMNCLSEVPREYLQFIIDNVFPLTNTLYVVDGPTSGYPEFWDVLQHGIDGIFRNKRISVFNRNKDTYSIIARRK